LKELEPQSTKGKSKTTRLGTWMRLVRRSRARVNEAIPLETTELPLGVLQANSSQVVRTEGRQAKKE